MHITLVTKASPTNSLKWGFSTAATLFFWVGPLIPTPISSGENKDSMCGLWRKGVLCGWADLPVRYPRRVPQLLPVLHVLEGSSTA